MEYGVLYTFSDGESVVGGSRYMYVGILRSLLVHPPGNDNLCLGTEFLGTDYRGIVISLP